MFSQELFADIVTTYSFCFKTSAENSPWMKINCMESCLGTCRFTYQNVVYYILLWIFSVFLASLMVVSIKIGYQCVFCFNLMNNSFLLKYRELRLLALFLLIILEMRSSAALGCAACVCLFVCFFFFRNLWVWEKIHSKIVNLWNEEPTVRPCERHRNRMTQDETVRVQRSDIVKSKSTVSLSKIIKKFQ